MAKLVSQALAAIFLLSGATGVTGCAVQPLDDEPVAESEDHLLAGRRVSETEIARLVRQAGFPESMVGKMICTAKWESSFYERARHRNNNGSTDYGLFQINNIHLGERGCPSSASGLYDAAANARCAYTVYKQQGINAWYGYKKHRSECNRYSAPASGGSSSAETDNSEPGGCWSGTLEEMVEANTCVQSKFDGIWYECHNGKWYSGVEGGEGPYGACTSSHAYE